jgi:MFS family permease
MSDSTWQAQAQSRAGMLWLWVGVVSIAVLYLCSTLPTPLYPLYRREFGFSELTVTAIYASYVIGNLAVLFALGRISDQVGRRPAVLVAFGILGLSLVAFLLASSTAWLFAARILNGVAAGLGAAALTAWIAELEPHHDRARAATVATAGNLAGLSAGPLLAGLMVRAAPWPLRSSYLVYLVIVLLMAAVIQAAPEGVQHVVRGRSQLSLRPRIGLPRQIRRAFIAPAAMAFATFALGGFYAALTPGLLSQSLHQHSPLLIGAVVGLFFGIGAIGAALSGGVGNRLALKISTVLMLLSLGALVTAEHFRSMPLLLLATIVGGIAMALGFRSSLQIVNQIAPAEQRAEVVSSYLLVCYSANSLPVIGVGLLSRLISAPAAHACFAVLLAALVLSASVAGSRFVPRE